MLASGRSTNNHKGLAKVLGVDRRNIQKVMDRWIQLDTTKDAFWITSRQAKHSNSLFQTMKDLVAHYGQ
jgi:hypothetical protein